MAQKHMHYMVDCFYSDPLGVDGFRRESFPIGAGGDHEAISEAKIYGPLTKSGNDLPSHFQLRVVSRQGDTVIFKEKVGTGIGTGHADT